jgi:hypothetical protein
VVVYKYSIIPGLGFLTVQHPTVAVAIPILACHLEREHIGIGIDTGIGIGILL